jgi:hypothetical protein
MLLQGEFNEEILTDIYKKYSVALMNNPGAEPSGIYCDFSVSTGVGGADKNLDYYRTPKGVFICILKNKNQVH